jgi:hypothetical protein
MKKPVFIAAMLGGVWMLVVVLIPSVRLAYLTNPIGMSTLDWLPRARGIAAPINVVVADAYLVLISALQWGLAARLLCWVKQKWLGSD